MTRKEIKDLLGILLDAYPYMNGKINNPKGMLDNWEMIFGEYEADAVYKAARLHMATSSFFPAIYDIKEKINKASIVYAPEPPLLKITAGKESYSADNIYATIKPFYHETDGKWHNWATDEQIDYLLNEFCEGGSLGLD